MEEEVKWENLKSIKQTEETRKNAINCVGSKLLKCNRIMSSFPERNTSRALVSLGEPTMPAGSSNVTHAFTLA